MQVICGMHYYTHNSILCMGVICYGNYKHIIKKSTVIISDNFMLSKSMIDAVQSDLQMHCREASSYR